MKEEEPGLWEKTAHIMLPKDYLIFRLTGELATDYSDAAGTLLLDVAAKKGLMKSLRNTALMQKFFQSFIIRLTVLEKLVLNIERNLALKKK